MLVGLYLVFFVTYKIRITFVTMVTYIIFIFPSFHCLYEIKDKSKLYSCYSYISNIFLLDVQCRNLLLGYKEDCFFLIKSSFISLDDRNIKCIYHNIHCLYHFVIYIQNISIIISDSRRRY